MGFNCLQCQICEILRHEVTPKLDQLHDILHVLDFFFLTRANLYLSSIFIPDYVNIFINFSPFASLCFPLKDREEDFDCQICPS